MERVVRQGQKFGCISAEEVDEIRDRTNNEWVTDLPKAASEARKQTRTLMVV